MGCCKHQAWILLIVGILYLLQDLGSITFWNVSWYTVVFVLWGLSGVLGQCCEGECSIPKGKKRK